jgi:hypothetical protein
MTSSVTTESGLLQWEATSVTPIVAGADAAWQSYQLPSNTDLYGLTISNGSLWAVDQGRQKLIRLPLITTRSIYLPLIQR